MSAPPRRPRSVRALEAENAVLRKAIEDCWWFARRYADGRMTHAASTYNSHTRALLALGLHLNPTGDGTLWARDGAGRRFDGLSDAEAAEGDRPPVYQVAAPWNEFDWLHFLLARMLYLYRGGFVGDPDGERQLVKNAEDALARKIEPLRWEAPPWMCPPSSPPSS